MFNALKFKKTYRLALQIFNPTERVQHTYQAFVNCIYNSKYSIFLVCTLLLLI